MKILVTGGAGFIGSTFVRHLLDRSDDEVVVYDALTYAGVLANLADLERHPRFRFVLGDVCDRAQLRAAAQGVDAVVHFAAESNVDRSLLDPTAFVRTNCLGTEVACAVAAEVGVVRFVHVSTDEVYGSVPVGSCDEDAPLRPTSPYSASKASSDLIALSHVEASGLPVVVTRSTNAYGPRQFPEKMIPLFVTALLDGGPIPMYGDGRHVRDWLAVDDNCRAIDLVLRHGTPGEVYNVGAGNERESLEVAHLLLDLLGLGRERVHHVGDRPGHDRRYSVDAGRLHGLGWRPEADFEDALEATVAWYVANEPWWRPLLPQVRLLRSQLDRDLLVT